MSKWKLIKLSDIFDLQMGKTPSRNCKDYWDNGKYKWVSIADIGKTDKYIYETKEKITEKAILESGIKLVPKGTIIMSFKLSLGKTCVTGEDIYTNEAIMAFLDKSKYKFSRDYIYHLFSNYNWKQNTNKAVKGITLNKATLSKLKIPLPPLEVQHKIASILDTVSEVLKLRKQQLNELDLLVKSKFVEMFGDPVENPYNWEKTTLKDVATEQLSYGSGASAIDYDGKYRYIRITDIKKDGSLGDDIKSASEIDEKYILNDGDILFARSGASVGKTFYYSNKFGSCIYAGYLIRFIPNKNKVLPEYIFNYTKTEYYLSFINNAQRIVAQPNINAQQYGNLIISIPPIDLQNKFATFVQHVDELKSEVQKSINETQTLFDSLMQRYFE